MLSSETRFLRSGFALHPMMIEAAWRNAGVVNGENSDIVRLDEQGRLMQRELYGRRCDGGWYVIVKCQGREKLFLAIHC